MLFKNNLDDISKTADAYNSTFPFELMQIQETAMVKLS